MSSNRFGIIGLVAAVFLLVPVTIQAATVEERLARLELEIKDMKKTADFNNKRLAEALANFEMVREEINTMVGQIGEIRHEVETENKTRAQELQEMTHRLARMEEQLGDQVALIRDLAGDELAKKADGKGKQAAEELLYKKAFSEMTLHNYKQGAELFRQFIKKYPKSQLADNAQYWLGECLYSMGDYEKAILEFQKVIKQYPKGDKSAAAILKQGLAFYELKSYADAKAFLEKVVVEYPKSEEAVQAREKMVQVDEAIKMGTPAPSSSL